MALATLHKLLGQSGQPWVSPSWDKTGRRIQLKFDEEWLVSGWEVREWRLRVMIIGIVYHDEFDGFHGCCHCDTVICMWSAYSLDSAHCCEWCLLASLYVFKHIDIMNVVMALSVSATTLEVKKKTKTVDYGDSHYEGCRAMVVWIS